MKQILIFIVAGILMPFIVFSQSGLDSLLVKLNKTHRENRLMITGEVQEIYVNKTNKIIDIDAKIISLNNYTASYDNSYDNLNNRYHKENLDIVSFKCLEGNCIYNQSTSTYHNGYGIYFKSKKACYDFINLLDEIRSLLII